MPAPTRPTEVDVELDLYVALDKLRRAAVRCLLRGDDKRRDALTTAIEEADAALGRARKARSGEHFAAGATRTTGQRD